MIKKQDTQQGRGRNAEIHGQRASTVPQHSRRTTELKRQSAKELEWHRGKETYRGDEVVQEKSHRQKQRQTHSEAEAET